jgi:ADP-ribose pyrophosphatase YjhB (NUDIX family)
MIVLGVNVAIVQSGKILLTKREDFEVWCIPGGQIDPGESLAQAAVREAGEETGLEVELQRLVGVYSRTGSGVDVHLALFVARPVGGRLEPQVGEVLELGYFAPDALPEDMLWWHRQPVADVFDGVGSGVAWSFNVKTQQKVNSRAELYALRDRSGLSRSEFYKYFFEQGGTDEAKLEAGSIKPRAEKTGLGGD